MRFEVSHHRQSAAKHAHHHSTSRKSAENEAAAANEREVAGEQIEVAFVGEKGRSAYRVATLLGAIAAIIVFLFFLPDSNTVGVLWTG